MLKSALVPLDGSPSSSSALTHAIRLAKSGGFNLVGLGIVDVPTIESGSTPSIGGGSFKTERNRALVEDARKKVAGFLTAFDEACGAAGIDFSSVALDGLPYQVINRQSRRNDIVVIGRNTCFHFETSDDPGETLGRLVKDSARPLLVVPEERRSRTTTLVATDDSTAFARTAQMFVQMGLCRDRPACVLNVQTDGEEAARQCEVTASYLRLHGFDVTEHPIASSGRPAEVILEHLESLSADLLVMGAHGGGKIHDLLFGSTTAKAIRHADVPLFIHH